jgi:hypothetical protein
MPFGVPRLKKALNCFFIAGLFGVLLSCNNYNNNNPYNPYNGSPPPSLSSITFRAYVSNPIQPSTAGVGGAPVLNIVDAATDILSPYTVTLASLSAIITDPGMMALSPKQDRILVSSPADRKIAIVNNAQTSVASAVTLPGATESFFVWSDNKTAFAAVPSASTAGESPGAVERIDLPTATITATIPIPGAHYIVPSPNGSAILVFSDDSDAVALLRPDLIGANTQSNAQVPCSSTQMAACTIPGTFDRPTGAVFNGSSATAYILNCGQQCGGVGAGPCLTFTSCTTVSGLDMTQSPPALISSVAVPAATTGLLQGNTLYVAGTPVLAADNNCAGVTTAATSCGRLTVVNVLSMTAAAAVVITDGYHDRIQMASNAQLFIGSRGCTNINTSAEVRGCLTIVNTSSGSISSSSVIVPPDNGDVTGMEPIPNRTVVYICEGGNLRVYETTTDKLEVFHQPATGPNVIGQAIDVKVVDF